MDAHKHLLLLLDQRAHEIVGIHGQSALSGSTIRIISVLVWILSIPLKSVQFIRQTSDFSFHAHGLFLLVAKLTSVSQVVRLTLH